MSIIFTIVVMNYLIFIMVSRYSAMEESRHEEELMIREIAYKDEYYQDVERYHDQIHDIKHDMKNRLIALYDTVSANSRTGIKEKLEEMLEDIRKAEDILYSSNPILNSILKVKASKARKQGIRMDVHAFIPRKISIDSGDMGVLYGNLLDNALEACQRMEQEDKFIEFETKYQNEKLLIIITNSKIPEKNLRFSTTKKDKRIHGRGIKTVRKVAEKYQGTLLLEDQGTTFEASLLLTGIICLE
ncbi:MAG: sensor histidine kinase [Candidatus Galacturonibacter soehngenii]|nr:sensor histidine kinase [Candidatus Galacturonibacter soehngenii]